MLTSTTNPDYPNCAAHDLETVPCVVPWCRVPLDEASSGAWVVMGDLDGDGRVEVVSARNVDRDDVHYTSAAVAQNLEGEVLWRWGDASIGRRGLHHDVACQIHDWDGDGYAEVILATDGWLVALDGASGAERLRLPLPAGASDCLVFADLTGAGHRGDLLVKDRYQRIWALDRSGRIRWELRQPGGFPTAHQPVPIDIDGDGREEVIVGYAMVNADGTIRWTLADLEWPDRPGHLDCCRLLRAGDRPAECRLVMTCCGHRRLLATDGDGALVWQLDGHHFESIDVGRISPSGAETQLLVDLVPCVETGDTDQLWIVDADGTELGHLPVDYARFHTLTDWNGDGLDELVVPQCRGLFDYRGKRLATFAVPPQADVYGGRPPVEGEIGHLVLAGNLAGNGRRDIAITTPDAVYLFANPNGSVTSGMPLGTAPNFSLY